MNNLSLGTNNNGFQPQFEDPTNSNGFQHQLGNLTNNNHNGFQLQFLYPINNNQILLQPLQNIPLQVQNSIVERLENTNQKLRTEAGLEPIDYNNNDSNFIKSIECNNQELKEQIKSIKSFIKCNNSLIKNHSYVQFLKKENSDLESKAMHKANEAAREAVREKYEKEYEQEQLNKIKQKQLIKDSVTYFESDNYEILCEKYERIKKQITAMENEIEFTKVKYPQEATKYEMNPKGFLNELNTLKEQFALIQKKIEAIDLSKQSEKDQKNAKLLQ